MKQEKLPIWLEGLDDEDLEFLRRFVLHSGSLKEMAAVYEVSYPTIRLRLDRLIVKVSNVPKEEDPYISMIKDLALDGDISFEVAKKLIHTYRERR